MIANARKRALLDAMNVFYMICASLHHSTQIWPRTKVKRPAVGSRKHAHRVLNSRDDRPWHTCPHVACTAWSRSGPAVRRREELGDHMRCSLHDDHCHAARSRSCQALMSAVSWAHTARSHEETRPPSLQDATDRRPVSPHDLIKPRSPRL